MEAIAMHSFTATAEDELSFKKGDKLKVLNMTDDKTWFKAEMNGREGQVPYNYINMLPHKWFLGSVTRNIAEETLLKSEQPDGAFLIRESESTPGDFSVSVKSNTGVQHFKILRDGSGKYFLWVVKFSSINELVEYHRTSSVSRSETIYLKDMVDQNEGTVRALYNFEAQGGDEMSFQKGDLITVISKLDANWWRGKLGDKEGLFPSNYVELAEK